MISQRERGELARFYTVTDPKKHQKGYTVYKVTARIISRKNPEDVQEITVWKRYSDFRKLHQNLWQLHKNLCSQSELFPPFAKAKVFGRFDDSVIEERRQCSEDLLQFSANIPALYSSQHIQDFFKGGEVHDGSELIGPAEPFSDFLADSLSDCSSEVQRDISGADDLTITSEYGGPSSDSDLTSLAVDTDSLAELDDGMASGRASPNQPQGGATNISSSCSPLLPSLHERRSPSPAPAPAPASGSSTPNQEVGRPSRTALFSSSLKRASGANPKDVKSDYLDRASEHICLAVQKEKEQDYQTAFSYYRSGVDLLLQGVQGEPSPTRREAVKKKTAEYLMRAEQISNQHLRSNMGQGSTQTVAMGAQCCPPTSRGGQQGPSEELRAYRVLGVIDKVLLVMDKRTQETFILKGLRKSSECGRTKRTIMPNLVPHMVQLKKFIVSEDTVFLLLQYAEGGKLWSHIGKFLRNSSPDESFDIPFIQKSHTTAVHSLQHAAHQLGLGSVSSGSGPVGGSDSGSGLQRKEKLIARPQKSGLPPGLMESLGAQSDSGATSEEECTNSYLTLCNEYEQDKVEPDALEEEEEKSGQEVLSLDVPAATTTTSSRTRSLLSNDSLSSPISSQELRFFTESSDNSGRTLDSERYRGEGQDHNEVFSPLPSPAAPLSLDQSKHTPMEFFRIDSKDSASEVTCLDPGELRPSHKPLSLFLPSTSDLGSEVTEDVPELAQEVKGHSSELWGLDCSDKGSNESVPVISFKEAVVEDEGHPPDLLVNLPVMSGTVDALQEELETSGVCLGLEATASPQKFTQPDVLQLPSQPEEEEEQPVEQELPSLCTVSATCEISLASSSSPCTSLWDDYSLAFGQEATDKMVDPACQNNDLLLLDDAVLVPPPSNTGIPVTDSLTEKLEPSTSVNTDLVPNPSGFSEDSIPATNGAEACTVVETLLGLDAESSRDVSNIGGSEYDKEVSRLFAELDELSLAASQARIPEEFVRCWAVEMVTALDALHQEGIVCRDLNPNNILLNHQGHVQLTYFCSWSEVEDSCDKEAIANMYCAPEVGGISEETAACDWWSLGAILFELLTGKSLLQCHPAGISRHTALNIPESVSEEAGSLLEQLLQYNPMERLGAGVGGVDDIKAHPFFARVDWPK
uniref:ribosomal protein S6 kinase delta-1 isoform X1 n=1 Tax=Centroberyx gerrardi TaxID=166262 RepID=UPI003AAC04E7